MALISKRKKYTTFNKVSSLAAAWLVRKGFAKMQKRSGPKVVGRAIAWGFVAGAAIGGLRYFAGKAAA